MAFSHCRQKAVDPQNVDYEKYIYEITASEKWSVTVPMSMSGGGSIYLGAFSTKEIALERTKNYFKAIAPPSQVVEEAPLMSPWTAACRSSRFCAMTLYNDYAKPSTTPERSFRAGPSAAAAQHNIELFNTLWEEDERPEEDWGCGWEDEQNPNANAARDAAPGAARAAAVDAHFAALRDWPVFSASGEQYEPNPNANAAYAARHPGMKDPFSKRTDSARAADNREMMDERDLTYRCALLKEANVYCAELESENQTLEKALMIENKIVGELKRIYKISGDEIGEIVEKIRNEFCG